MSCMVDSDIVVSEFELQSCYDICFQTNTIEKATNLNSTIYIYIYIYIYSF